MCQHSLQFTSNEWSGVVLTHFEGNKLTPLLICVYGLEMHSKFRHFTCFPWLLLFTGITLLSSLHKVLGLALGM